MQVIFSLIVASMTGARSLQDHESQYMRALFAFSLISGILGALLTFLGVEEKISQYHNTSSQYAEMGKDVKVFLLLDEDRDDYVEQEKIILEKEKFIAQYAPGLSGCLYCKKKKYQGIRVDTSMSDQER